MNAAILETVHADPFAKLLGIKVDRVDDGEAMASMEVKEDHLNFHGAANGGALFSLADLVFAIASNSHGQKAVGINVNINYMKAGNLGDTITAAAKEISKNPRLGHYRMEIQNQDGVLLATAEGTVYRKKEYFG